MARLNHRSVQDIPSVAGWHARAREDYDAAKQTRFQRVRSGIPSLGSSADYHYRSDAEYLRMLEYARDMERNDSVGGPLIDRAVDNTVKCGFGLDVATGDAELDKILSDKWREWSENPSDADIAGVMPFSQMERMVFRRTLVDGDILGLPVSSGHLQLVESHRCRSPRRTKKRIVHGVELDAARRRLRYWFTRDDIDANRQSLRIKDLSSRPAYDEGGFPTVFHVYNPKRVTQTRGVTAFAPVFDKIGMHEDIQFAKLLQQQIVSCFAIIRNRTPEFQPTSSSVLTGGTTTDTDPFNASRTLVGIGPGMDLESQVGETISGFSPNVPNPEFFDHVMLILNLISINLGVPLILLLMDATKTNFSGWRGAVDQARLGFMANQTMLAQHFHSPVYRWKVRQWLADDVELGEASLAGGVDIFGHTWTPPSWPYIEPLKDAMADVVTQRHALNSPRRIHSSRGRDWDKIATECPEDWGKIVRNAIIESQSIEQETGVAVPWEYLVGGPTADNINLTMQPETETADAMPSE
jgi:lambda family phage portal protein